MALPRIGKAVSSMRGRMPLPGGRGTTAALLGIGAVGLVQRNSWRSNKSW